MFDAFLRAVLSMLLAACFLLIFGLLLICLAVVASEVTEYFQISQTVVSFIAASIFVIICVAIFYFLGWW